jgi:general secretion pathway protein G
MREILAAAEIHSTRYGSHPESIRDLLDARDEMGRPSPLLTGDPRDPWGHEFVYEVVDESPRVTCLGRDGQPGGAGEDADIVIPAPRAE